MTVSETNTLIADRRAVNELLERRKVTFDPLERDVIDQKLADIVDGPLNIPARERLHFSVVVGAIQEGRSTAIKPWYKGVSAWLSDAPQCYLARLEMFILPLESVVKEVTA